MNPMFEEVDHPGIGRFLVPGSALDFGAAPRESVRPAPVLGEHTDEILAEDLGLSAAEIAGLYERRIVAGPIDD
jgi:2-methylfumaryl-CoA isomerase